MNRIDALVRAAGLVLCVGVFAGTALAGDKPKDEAPGNSGSAPGQQKKAEQAPPAAAPAPAPAPQATPAGRDKQAVKDQRREERKAAKAEQKSAKADQRAAKAKQRATAKAEREHARPATKPKAKVDAEKKAAKPQKSEARPKEPRSKGSGSYKATSSGTDLKKGMSHKHAICHATGSASNPYVVITPSVSGVFNGHLGHQDGRDIVPPFVYEGQTYSQNWDAEGQALFANGCRAAEPATTTTATTTAATTTTEAAACPPVTRTVTELVVGGVFHKTGKGYVFIRPSKSSAHYDASKHPDDIVVPDQTLTRTVAEPDTCQTTGGGTTTVEQATTTVTIAGATVTLPGSTTTLAGSTVTIPEQTVTVGGAKVAASEDDSSENEAAGVLGEQTPPGAAEESGPAGGVLGAVSSLGETARSGTLPFTGLPLWLVALVGGVLLAAGVGIRHTSQP